MDYKHFDTKTSRNEAIEIGNKLAEYVFERGAKNIMFLDRSARPGYIVFKKSWQKKFPNFKQPNIYFTNPDGFNTDKRDITEIIKEFDNTYKKISSNKKESLLLFDVCHHTGQTIQNILKALNQANYEDVGIMLAQPSSFNNYYKDKIEFLALNFHAEKKCYVFRRDKIIIKNNTSVVSSKNNNIEEAKKAKELRKELSSLF